MLDSHPSREQLFSNIYGEKIVVTIEKSSGYLDITIKRESKVSIYTYILLLIPLFPLLLQHSNMVLLMGALIVSLYISYIQLSTILEENIKAIKGLGYQIKAKGRLKNSNIFIPYDIVEHIFLNEVIFKNRVIFLPTLLTCSEKGTNKLVPIFRGTLPKLDCLKIIYQELMILNN